MTDRDDSSTDGGIDRRQFLGWSVVTGAAAAAVGVPTAAAQQTPELNRIWTHVLSLLPDNWGKWGDDDQLGAVNYLGDEQVQAGMEAAMRCGTRFQTFPLQLSYTGESVLPDAPLGDPVFPTRQAARRDNVVDARSYRQGQAEPLRGGMRFADDAFITRLFLQGSTQYDALAHVWYNRLTEDGDRQPLMYNGFDAMETAAVKEFDKPIPGLRPPEGGDPFSTDLQQVDVTQTRGAAKNDILGVAERGTVGRGVLLDVGRYKKDEPPYRLDPDACVTLDDLRNTAKAQGVELEKRDILLVRTGSVERARDPEAEYEWLGDPEADLKEPGLCFSQKLVEWLHEMEIPVIGADNLAVEKLTTQTIDVSEDIGAGIRKQVDFGGRETLDIVNPLHPSLITNLGMMVVEILWLKELADACAEDGIYEFLYAASPLKIERGAGAPVNPVVVKARGN